MSRGTVFQVRFAQASSVVLVLLLVAAAGAAQDPPTLPTPISTPTPTPMTTLPESTAEGETAPQQPVQPTAEPPELVLEEVVGPPKPVEEVVGPPAPVEEVMGPPAPDHPVAHVQAHVVVTDKKHKKKGERKEELAGEAKVADKQWLSEVCPLDEKHGGSWLDRSQERLGWSVCRATLWFDGLFGDERAITERDATYGYVQPRVKYNDHDGVDPDAKFRAKYNLPLANRRFNALLGRNESDDDPAKRSPSDDNGTEQLPQSFRETDDEWLVGLGYSPVRGNRKRLDFDAGVQVGTSPDVFVQGRYRRHWFMSERDLVRARQTVFWRTDDGLGTRLNLDFEHMMRGPFVFRWRNGATYAQQTEGVDWFEEFTLFHRLGLKTALAYVLSADGETDAEVPERNYGLEMIYRRNILREWLFVELRPGLDWRRREIEQNRKIEPTLSVGLQINFGDRDFE